MGKSEHKLSRQDTVCTPEEIWGPIVRALGPIGLDPCSNPASTVPAQSQILLPDYWTDPDKPAPTVWHDCGEYDLIYGDGLTFSWKGCGLVYWNAPYSQLPTHDWVRKGRDDVDESVGLVPVRTATSWWQDEITKFTAITYLRARIVHDNVFNKQGELVDDPSPFGQALVYNGPRLDVWLEHFLPMGHTVLGVR